jgi:hypothetical protein
MSVNHTGKNDSRDYALENFRAFAVLIVVFSHCVGGYIPNSDLGTALYIFVRGGTTLFVVITGYFLHRIYFERDNYVKLLKTKTLTLGIPYLFLSTAVLLFKLVSEGNLPDYPMHSQFFGNLSNIELFMIYLLTGTNGGIGYWFIPFYLFLIFLSPLFMKFSKLNINWQRFVFLIALLLSSIVWRPSGDLNLIQLVVYYSPFCLLGMYFSEHEAKIRKAIVKFTLPLAFCLCSISVFMQFNGTLGNKYKQNLFEYSGMDWMVFKQFFLICFLFSIIYRYFDRKIEALKKIAQQSLPIFFLHGLFIPIIDRIDSFEFFFLNTFTRVLLFITTVFFSMCASNVIHRVLGNHSKYLIGK